MKKLFLLLSILTFGLIIYGQTDTISENIYQNNGRLGIGLDIPTYTLQINNNISSGIERNLLKINNESNGSSSYTGIILKTGEENYQSVIQDYGINYIASTHYDFGGFLNLSNNSKGLMLHANSFGGIIKFYTGHDEIAGAGIERLRIGSTGNIGIGTKEPAAKLQVAEGDIFISDIEKGIIMKSPDGNCWRGVLDNSGQLTFISIDCPEMQIPNKTQQFKASENILVYPNPSNTRVIINLLYNQLQKPEYIIYNTNGQIQESGKITSNHQTIDISGLSAGIYLLNVYDKKGDKLITKKIIKE